MTKNFFENFDKQSGVGRERVVTVFLFFPRIIGGNIRWLCRAKVLQRYLYVGVTDDLRGRRAAWCDVEWMK